jgi:hypothetical protein
MMARILVYTHVLRGPEARQRPETWLEFYEAFIGIIKKKASAERQSVYLAASMALYHIARARWLKLADVPQA